MKALIQIVDDNGKPQTEKLVLLEPMTVENKGIATTYRFMFEISRLNKEPYTMIEDYFEGGNR